MPAPMRYPRQWEWPNKAKIAMTVNLAMEAFKFKSQYTQEGRPGRVDHFSLSYARYGAKPNLRLYITITGAGFEDKINGEGRHFCRALPQPI